MAVEAVVLGWVGGRFHETAFSQDPEIGVREGGS